MKKPNLAVFPVAGLGTRFLPFTKSIPKELLPLNSRPVLEYAVNEAKEAGIERFVFVNSPSKPHLEEYFRCAPALERQLQSAGKHSELQKVQATNLGESLHVVYQKEPLGLGHAVFCAQPFVGDEPFAVLLPDDFIHADTPVLAQMIEAYANCPGNYVATHDVGASAISNYGCLDIEASLGRTLKLRGIVEKPKSEDAPSTFAVVGRYILEPKVVTDLAFAKPTVNGEVQLTDVIAQQDDLFAFRFKGSHYDCGRPTGYAAANTYMTSGINISEVPRRTKAKEKLAV